MTDTVHATASTPADWRTDGLMDPTATKSAIANHRHPAAHAAPRTLLLVALLFPRSHGSSTHVHRRTARHVNRVLPPLAARAGLRQRLGRPAPAARSARTRAVIRRPSFRASNR